MNAQTPTIGPDSVAADVLQGVDLRGKRALVTGASSGIGAVIAQELACAGANVTLAVRDIAAGHQVATRIRRLDRVVGSVSVRRLDLSDIASVDYFAATWASPLHILVNNAGIMATPELRTPHGWEMQFATNHLGHFALTLGLHRALKSARSARVVCLSSSGHQRSPVIFDDLNFDFRQYDPWLAYGQSKTANILFAVEAARRFSADGIAVNAVTPGAVITNLQRYTGGAGSGQLPDSLFRTAEHGAAGAVFLAASARAEGQTGGYFYHGERQEVITRRSGTLRGLAAYACDPGNAERLWSASLELIESARAADLCISEIP